MQRETRQDGWVRYGQISRSVQDCEGIDMLEARFLGDMLDIILRCFGLLLLAALGAVVIWEIFGVVGIIVWWLVLGIAAVMIHYPSMGSHQRNG